MKIEKEKRLCNGKQKTHEREHSNEKPKKQLQLKQSKNILVITKLTTTAVAVNPFYIFHRTLANAAIINYYNFIYMRIVCNQIIICVVCRAECACVSVGKSVSIGCWLCCYWVDFAKLPQSKRVDDCKTPHLIPQYTLHTDCIVPNDFNEYIMCATIHSKLVQFFHVLSMRFHFSSVITMQFLISVDSVSLSVDENKMLEFVALELALDCG